MAEIPLRNRAGDVVAVALVDDADFARISTGSWHLHSAGYATGRQGGGRGPKVFMHRAVLGLGPGDPLVDHINGDKLDNRRSNLRAVDATINGHNRARSKAGATSSLVGVSWAAWANRWRGQVSTGGHNYHVGYYDSQEECARAVAAFRARLVRGLAA